MSLELTILVPAYNEADRLAHGMARFDAAVTEGAIDVKKTELVVVDDGSTDGTGAVAAGLLADLPHHRVLTLPTNRGKGAAVRAGVTVARGAHTAYMDADMAIDPRAVPSLLDALMASDVAIGSRALTDSMVDGSYALRSVMGRLFNQLVTTGTGLGLKDTQCGFKAFRTPVARLLFHLVRIDRFAFDVEVLIRARRLGLRVTEVPVQWKHVPGSTIHPLHDSVSMLVDVTRSRLGLLATPSVPTVVVHDAPAPDRDDPLSERVGRTVAATLGGVPVPMVTDGGSVVVVVLALVEPVDAAAVYTGLTAEFGRTQVVREALSLEELAALGPLAGRLDPPPAADDPR